MRTTSPPSWVWDSSAFRDAVAAGQPGAALASIRQGAGMSQHDFAAALGWDTSTLRRAERGQSNTLFDLRELARITHVLAIPAAAFAPLLGISATLDTLVDPGATVDRRDFGKAVSTTAAIAVFGDSTAMAAAGRTVGAAHVDYLRAMAQRLDAANVAYGGAEFAPAAVRAYQDARTLLASATYSSKTGTALCEATAALGNLAGWLTYQGGDHPAARQLLNESLSLATQGSDHDLTIRILCDMVHQCTALSDSRPGFAREAVRLALRAADLARQGPKSVLLQGDLDSRAALAHAAAGDEREFERAMNWAWRAFEDGFTVGDDDPARLSYLNQSEIQRLEASGYRRVGQPVRALELAQAAAETSPYRGAIRRAVVASSLADIGDLTEAFAVGNTVLDDLGSVVHAPRILGELRPLRAAVQDGADFAVRFDAMATAS